MVTIFFVISGYVLSQKGLSQIRAGRTQNLLADLSSSALRRLYRIWTPVLIVSFVELVLLRCGLGVQAKRHNIEIQDTFMKQVAHWARLMMGSIQPFSYRDRRPQTHNPYGKTAWSLRKCSILSEFGKLTA